jgi:hypothetical protein
MLLDYGGRQDWEQAIEPRGVVMMLSKGEAGVSLYRDPSVHLPIFSARDAWRISIGVFGLDDRFLPLNTLRKRLEVFYLLGDSAPICICSGPLAKY